MTRDEYNSWVQQNKSRSVNKAMAKEAFESVQEDMAKNEYSILRDTE